MTAPRADRPSDTPPTCVSRSDCPARGGQRLLTVLAATVMVYVVLALVAPLVLDEAPAGAQATEAQAEALDAPGDLRLGAAPVSMPTIGE